MRKRRRGERWKREREMMTPEERAMEAAQVIAYNAHIDIEDDFVKHHIKPHVLEAIRAAVAEAETVAQEAGKSIAMLSEQLARAEQRQAAAVAAEREACCAAICGLCAGINPLYGPAEYAQRPSLGNRWFWEHPFVEDEKEGREPGLRAVPCQAAAIRARGGGDDNTD